MRSSMYNASRFGSHFTVNDNFNTLGTRSLRYGGGPGMGNNFRSVSCDPLKLFGKSVRLHSIRSRVCKCLFLLRRSHVVRVSVGAPVHGHSA
jgi:hypothetical protein